MEGSFQVGTTMGPLHLFTTLISGDDWKNIHKNLGPWTQESRDAGQEGLEHLSRIEVLIKDQREVLQWYPVTNVAISINL